MTAPSPTSSSSNKALSLLKRYWLPLLLIVIAIIFIAQNTQRVSVDFLFLSFRSWLWLILTIVALGGLVAGWFLGRNSVKKP